MPLLASPSNMQKIQLHIGTSTNLQLFLNFHLLRNHSSIELVYSTPTHASPYNVDVISTYLLAHMIERKMILSRNRIIHVTSKFRTEAAQHPYHACNTIDSVYQASTALAEGIDHVLVHAVATASSLEREMQEVDVRQII